MNNTVETAENRSELQAAAQLESIREMVADLESENEAKREAALERIHEDPLSIEVRTDWHTLGATDQKPTHYRILLCWGGPAAQIVGELSEHLEPETATIQHQDWGTPWTDYHGGGDDAEAVLLAYARCFYFGE